MAGQDQLLFPPGFLWGTATSAHQVEGGNDKNQFWAWEQGTGRVWHDQRSGRACDWWERAEEDLAVAAELGQNTHRLSIEWSRIEPADGIFDDRPLERYRRLLERMRELGLEPMVTLYHFTHPQWLEAQGGWLNPETVARFARYCARAVEALGDQVRLWCTINEPMIVASLSYLFGRRPPQQRSLGNAMRVAANLLLGHAAAYHAVHRVRPDGQAGLTSHIRLFDPARPGSPLDRTVAYLLDYIFNRIPVLATIDGRLRIPLTPTGRRVPELANTCDLIGLDYYTRDLVAFDLRRPGELFGRRFYAPGTERCDPGWRGDFGEIYPQGLRRCVETFAGLGKPIYVTEVGWTDAADTRRPRALLTHVAELWRAIAAGAPVRGLYHWSLVDNYEWDEGWGVRFGLIELDPVTQVRTPRRSAEVYAAIARANGITREIVERYAPEAMERIFP